jgi:DNA-binding transcriptional MerR regulator
MYRITALARKFGLSRSTLLYYDRIGLLQPAGRSEAGYRLYSKGDVERLKTVCEYKQAGLAIDDIRRMLEKPQEGSGIAINSA